MAEPRAFVVGCSGLELTDAEASFFRDADPFGFILFRRNVASPDQVTALTASLRDSVGRDDAPVLIDQEGGRVQRMRPPHWRLYLPALDQMRRARDPMRAQWVRNRLIAAELRDAGVDVNCAPLADLVEEGTHPILLNRLYGGDVDTVVRAARACSGGLMAGGVLPVLKHLPGYGRARVDSHHDLPRVSVPRAELESRDFPPFRGLNDLPMGMTAHIVLDAVDPTRPATTSPEAIRVIREDIGFDGLLMTDDVGMQALSGPIRERAERSIAAGVDIALQCNGEPADMTAAIQGAGRLEGEAQLRADRALALRRPPEPADIPALVAELDGLLPEGA